MMKYSPHYADIFNQYYSMMEAIVMVEQTPSRVVRYRIFFGNAGLMEHEEPLKSLVANWLKQKN